MKINFPKLYFLRVLFVCIPLLFSSFCLAEELTPEQSASIQQQIQAQLNDPALNQQKLEEYKQYEARKASRTPDEVAEERFNEQNMIINERGEREVRPQATGQRQIISSRLVVNEQGQIEGIPDENERAVRKEMLKEIKKRDANNIAGMKRWNEQDDPVQTAETEAKMKEASAKADKETQDKIDQWEKDAEDYRKSMKTLVSIEK